MANTYTQVHLHFVFAVQHKEALIAEPIRERVERYITGIVQHEGHKMMAIFCMPDHLHMLVGFRPIQSMADLMKEVKSKSTDFINKNRLTNAHFHWQEGYGAFSYSRSHVPQVIQYILNQQEHHRKHSFKEEYLDLLQKFEVAYDERYLFNWLV